MGRKKHRQETVILSITKAAQQMDIPPRRLRYLIQKHAIKPVPALDDDSDKRCKFYVFTDLLSVAAR